MPAFVEAVLVSAVVEAVLVPAVVEAVFVPVVAESAVGNEKPPDYEVVVVVVEVDGPPRVPAVPATVIGFSNPLPP